MSGPRTVGIESLDLDDPRADPTWCEQLQRARSGDVEACSHLLAGLQSRVHRIASIRLGKDLRRHVDSMDIVQETFLIASRKIVELRATEPAEVLHWLGTIAEGKVRDVRDRWTAKRRDLRRAVPLPDSDDPALERESASPHERVFQGEVKELVDRRVEELPEMMREVILLRDYQHMDWEAIADATGRPTAAAAEQAYLRAWVRLRRLLRPYFRDLEASRDFPREIGPAPRHPHDRP